MTDLLLLPGDGIGPEVLAEVRKVAAKLCPELTIDERPFGGASIDLFDVPLTKDTLAAAKSARAVLMGAVGGDKWKDVPRKHRPEAGLLGLRTGLGLFANLRPAFCFRALADASSLKRERIEGMDLVVVRELTGGIYFGEPRFIEELPDGSRRGVDTQIYTSAEIERIGRVAFALARKRRNKVTSCEKSNVMETGLLWREVMRDLHEREFPDVEFQHMLADHAAIQIVRDPKQFDVMVMDNLFGDILSDVAAQVTGSLLMLPSAAIGAAGEPALFEPMHGTVSAIAGRGLANPLGAILSFEMALRWSLGAPEQADQLLAAVERALEGGARTQDFGGNLSTAEMGRAVIEAL